MYFKTFGCKVNICETAFMSETLLGAGYELTEELGEADAVVVNSCTVTAGSDRKVRNFLRRAKRLRPSAVTLLTGCFPQTFPEAATAIPEADVVTGNVGRKDVAALLQQFLDTRERLVSVVPHSSGEAFEPLPMDSVRGHTRAFLKIEDGCDRFCSYCILPHARGEVRSLPPEQIAAEAGKLSNSGHREITLTGINLSAYGGGVHSLADAVAAASAPEGVLRVRLSSLEPDLITDNLLDILAAEPKFCSQFHLSLQSGCDRTLAAMGRFYTAEVYTAVSERIRARFRDPTFTTDILVGFPGETERDFEESLDFVAGFGFLKCHVFPYSARPKTKAAALPQLPRAVKEERAARMAKAAGETREAVLHGFIGSRERVILESESGGYWTGYSDRYIPLRVKGYGLQPGMAPEVKITAAGRDFCDAEL